jgi:hypothetical protein
LNAAQNRFLNHVRYKHEVIMSNFWKAIFCFVFTSFFSNPVMADLDFFSRIYLSNKKYEKFTSIESYLVVSDQLTDVFDQKNSTFQQKRRQELNDAGEDLFLVVKCKNTGDRYAFGELLFNVKGMNLDVPILCSGLHGNMRMFANIAIIYIGSLHIPGDDEFPKITYYWKNLYTL